MYFVHKMSHDLRYRSLLAVRYGLDHKGQEQHFYDRATICESINGHGKCIDEWNLFILASSKDEQY